MGDRASEDRLTALRSLDRVIVAACRSAACAVLATGPGVGNDLLGQFGLVRDGRSGLGRDHPVAAVLVLAAAAGVAGVKGYTAIAGWVTDVPPPVLADLYLRAGARPARPPSKATIWRGWCRCDGTARWCGAPGTARGISGACWRRWPVPVRAPRSWPRRPRSAPTRTRCRWPPRCSGRSPERHDRHLGRAAHGEGDRRVHLRARQGVRAAGQGEPPGPVRDAGWAGTRSRSRTRRPTGVTARSPPAPSRSFLPGGPAVSARQSGPADRTLRQRPSGQYVRGHWAIESLHWLRDTLYQEDRSQVRTRSGPRVMAALRLLRNLAISALRLAGRTDITEATRWASRCMGRPFAVPRLSR